MLTCIENNGVNFFTKNNYLCGIIVYAYKINTMGIFTKSELDSIILDNKVLSETGATFVVLDEKLQVLYVNYTANDDKKKMNPGDLIKCSNAIAAEGGCGTHENCKLCNFRRMVEESLQTKSKCETDAELLVATNEDYNVHAVSTPFMHDGKVYTVVLLIDKTDHHHQLMMERIFFHDVLNLSGALNGILECMQSDDTEEMVDIVKGISGQLMNEIMAQRDLIYAQNGILEPKHKKFKAAEALDFINESLLSVALDMWAVNLKIESSLTDEMLDSDITLVNRVIHNMVKNACEASPNTTITVRAYPSADNVVFSVNNDAVMPSDVKSKVFIYGNSTKGTGRGLGTYSMKLIGENYLKGRVWFKSEEGFGTEFYFELGKAE